jgi:hypothetical protein
MACFMVEFLGLILIFIFESKGVEALLIYVIKGFSQLYFKNTYVVGNF